MSKFYEKSKNIGITVSEMLEEEDSNYFGDCLVDEIQDMVATWEDEDWQLLLATLKDRDSFYLIKTIVAVEAYPNKVSVLNLLLSLIEREEIRLRDCAASALYDLLSKDPSLMTHFLEADLKNTIISLYRTSKEVEIPIFKLRYEELAKKLEAYKTSHSDITKAKIEA